MDGPGPRPTKYPECPCLEPQRFALLSIMRSSTHVILELECIACHRVGLIPVDGLPYVVA